MYGANEFDRRNCNSEMNEDIEEENNELLESVNSSEILIVVKIFKTMDIKLLQRQQCAADTLNLVATVYT